MAADVLEKPEAEQFRGPLLPEGSHLHVVPDELFANVQLDGSFTGPASQNFDAPYFSQLANLDDMVYIYTDYGPQPVHRTVYVGVGVRGAFLEAVKEELLTGAAVSAVSAEGIIEALPSAAPLDLPLRRTRKRRKGVERIKRQASEAAGLVKRQATEAADRVKSTVENLSEVTNPALSLDKVAAELRDVVDLPVQDIARMCGMGRRQYYNVLRGATKTTTSEQHMRKLHRMLKELRRGLAGDAELVRAAVLLPLEGTQFRSFFDEASSGEDERMQLAFAEVKERLEDAAGAPRRPSPSGTLPPDAPEWREAADFLRGYPPVEGEDPA